MKKITTGELAVRDPFVLTDRANHRYILYRSNQVDGVEAFYSPDLTVWEGPQTVFRADKMLQRYHDFWAPEVHLYRGKYYLFLTLTPPEGCRGTWCFRADAPQGPFERFSDKPLTPENDFALDGTLWVENDVPYLVFCHEWVQINNGTINAVQLAADLSGAVGEPFELFAASKAPWTIPKGEDRHRITDGPFFWKRDGRLFLIWSGFSARGYATGVAESSDGTLRGAWHQYPVPLFDDNGGHGMIFMSLDGTPVCVLHAPNRPAGAERMRFFPVAEKIVRIAKRPDDVLSRI